MIIVTQLLIFYFGPILKLMELSLHTCQFTLPIKHIYLQYKPEPPPSHSVDILVFYCYNFEQSCGAANIVWPKKKRIFILNILPVYILT